MPVPEQATDRREALSGLQIDAGTRVARQRRGSDLADHQADPLHVHDAADLRKLAAAIFELVAARLPDVEEIALVAHDSNSSEPPRLALGRVGRYDDAHNRSAAAGRTHADLAAEHAGPLVDRLVASAPALAWRVVGDD